jgi:hypothetical protein
MRKHFSFLILSACIFFSNTTFAGNPWTRVGTDEAARLSPSVNASHYLVYTADEPALKGQLFALSTDRSKAQVVELPMPDGSMRAFSVWYTPMMPDELAARHPEIRTFTGIATDDPHVTTKLDFGLYSFHAMIFDGGRTSFIDPAGNNANGYYTVHYRKDEIMKQDESVACVSVSNGPVIRDKIADLQQKGGAKTINGHQLRTYRLALACSHQYAVAATGLPTPLKKQVFDKMTTTMNRVNGVYERELSITMNFVANEDTIIWVQDVGGTNGPDPYSSVNSDATTSIAVNQTICDSFIGTGNYDIGHLFTTGAGGFSYEEIVCIQGSKAMSVTGKKTPTGDGFDIDYVAHEMGHEFAATHTFANGIDSSCGFGNIEVAAAYEPGSGSTIMAYAGICGPDNIQPHSDDYFHAISLIQIQTYLNSAIGGSCGIKTPTNNKLVNLSSFQASYSIPFLTPFELSVPAATDSVADTLTTYCWEQWNLSGLPGGERFSDTHEVGPLFRSYKPSKSPLRVFPKDTMVLAGQLSNAGNNNNQGEKAPDVARYLTFRLTVRDIFNGLGCILIPDDTIHLDAINTGTGFKVTSQGDSTLVYVGSAPQTITWDVVGTNNSPINASNVDIYMSEDGGYHWPHHIGTFPNTGSASVPLPNPDTTTLHARIKVKGTGNVFFNVNKYDFTVTHSDGTDTTVRIYPNPVHSILRISSGNKGELQFRIYNDIGQLIYGGAVNGLYDISTDLWARGIYFIRLIDVKGRKTVKKFVVQ